MTKTYRSEALAAVHEMIEGLHEAGAVDKQTMRDFDDACLAPAHLLAPDEIRAIREAERVSQPVFARYLNVSRIWSPTGSAAPSGRAVRRFGCCRSSSGRAWRRWRSDAEVRDGLLLPGVPRSSLRILR